MNCHSVLFANASYLEPVRASFRDNSRCTGLRVHDLPDFVYFNHSIHIKKGVGCETCHGRIDQMPLTYQQNSLLMEWCINCHKNPQDYVRPRSEITTMGYRPAVAQSVLGPQLVKEYGHQPAAQLFDVSPVSQAHMEQHNDIEALRAKLEAHEGREYWRSLESLAETPEFKEFLHREFPQNASEWLDPVGRRGFSSLWARPLPLRV
jgi:MoCo/4Fe-4S cofactor protein with predicted Tat translocation signal